MRKMIEEHFHVSFFTSTKKTNAINLEYDLINESSQASIERIFEDTAIKYWN